MISAAEGNQAAEFFYPTLFVVVIVRLFLRTFAGRFLRELPALF